VQVQVLSRARIFGVMFLKRLLHYLDPRTLFGKSNPNVNLRFMHGINRISIFLFLVCIGVMVWRGCMR
jgi:hypothetical protein